MASRASGHAVTAPAGLLDRRSSAGQPLPPVVQRAMEALFEADFSPVRVHVGPAPGRLRAAAFTHGADIHIAPGRYQPMSRECRQLLGHQLAHVVQQRQGRVTNPFGTGLAVVTDPALQAEAARMGLYAAHDGRRPQPPRPSPPVQPQPARRAITGAQRGGPARDLGVVQPWTRVLSGLGLATGGALWLASSPLWTTVAGAGALTLGLGELYSYWNQPRVQPRPAVHVNAGRWAGPYDDDMLRGGAHTIRVNQQEFWNRWVAQQRDHNINGAAVQDYRTLIRGGGHIDAPFVDSIDIGGGDIDIRTSEGRHRIHAAHAEGLTHFYILRPAEQASSSSS